MDKQHFQKGVVDTSARKVGCHRRAIFVKTTLRILAVAICIFIFPCVRCSAVDATYNNLEVDGQGNFGGAIVLGNGTAGGSYSIAVGSSSVASGNYSMAIGNHATAQGQDQLVIGQYNSPLGSGTSVSGTNPLFIIGNGTSGTSTSNALVMLENGFMGIGTSTPSQQLEITGNFQLPLSGSSGGVIYQNGTRLIHTTGNGNFFAGQGAGNLAGTSASNVAIGSIALTSVTTGGANVAMGWGSLYADQDGGGNTALGYDTLNNNISGGGNVAIGYLALFSGTANYNNVAIGSGALSSISGTALGVWDNTAVGGNSMIHLTTGQANTALGFGSLGNLTTGNDNTAVGFSALSVLTTGGQNVAIGEYAGVGSGSNEASSVDYDMTFIGYGAHRDGSVSGTTVLTNGVAIGLFASVGSSNTIALGGTGAYAVKVGVGKTTPTYTMDVAGDINITGNLYRNGTLISGTGATVYFGGVVVSSGSLSNGGYLAIGANANTSGSNAVTIGYSGTASGFESVVLGPQSTASGSYSTVFGASNMASGAYSTAMGNASTAQGYNQVVIGRYNTPQGSGNAWVATDDLFTIGNGSGTATPSDAFVVKKNGDTTVSGALTISGTTGNMNSIASGGLAVAGTMTAIVLDSGTYNTVVATGTNNLMLVPQQGDLSMGEFVSGQQPPH